LRTDQPDRLTRKSQGLKAMAAKKKAAAKKK